MKYRPEIDGHRAVAVISVILYHVGMIFTEIDLFYSDDDHLSKYGSKLLVADLFSKNQLILRSKE